MFRMRRFVDGFNPPLANGFFETVLYPELFRTGQFESRAIRFQRQNFASPHTYTLTQPAFGTMEY